MSGNWYELAIIAFIVLGIAAAVWRGGAANPLGTGALGRKVGKLSGTVSVLSLRVGHVEKELEELTKEAATVKDIERLEQKIEGHHELAERTCRSVERIERFLIEKGLGK
jgi:hypothetical protein